MGNRLEILVGGKRVAPNLGKGGHEKHEKYGTQGAVQFECGLRFCGLECVDALLATHAADPDDPGAAGAGVGLAYVAICL